MSRFFVFRNTPATWTCLVSFVAVYLFYLLFGLAAVSVVFLSFSNRHAEMWRGVSFPSKNIFFKSTLETNKITLQYTRRLFYEILGILFRFKLANLNIKFKLQFCWFLRLLHEANIYYTAGGSKLELTVQVELLSASSARYSSSTLPVQSGTSPPLCQFSQVLLLHSASSARYYSFFLPVQPGTSPLCQFSQVLLLLSVSSARYFYSYLPVQPGTSTPICQFSQVLLLLSARSTSSFYSYLSVQPVLLLCTTICQFNRVLLLLSVSSDRHFNLFCQYVWNFPCQYVRNFYSLCQFVKSFCSILPICQVLLLLSANVLGTYIC